MTQNQIHNTQRTQSNRFQPLLKLIGIFILLSGLSFAAVFTGTVTEAGTDEVITNGRVVLVRWATSGDSFITYHEVQTGAGGDFTFSHIETDDYRLYIIAEGYLVFADLSFTLSDDADHHFQLSVSNENGIEYNGQIVCDQSEAGIPGAAISRWVEDTEQGYWEIISITDENGQYHFTTSSSTTLVNMNALGYEPIDVSLTMLDDVSNIEYLTPFIFDGDISGYITDGMLGRNVSSATLTVYSTPADSMNSPSVYQISSDATGYYSIDNIPSGEATIFVNAEGYEGYFNTVEISENTVLNINIDELPETGKISGYVEYETGGAVSTETDQTFIEFIPISNNYHWVRAKIWSDGRYWADLPAGDYVVACFQGSANEIGGNKLINQVYFYPEVEVISQAAHLTVNDGIIIYDINFSIHEPVISPIPQYYSDILNGHSESYIESGLGDINYLLVAPPAEPEPGDIGDEIGVLDFNGMPSDGDCTGMEGEILVGATSIGNNGSTIIIPVFEYINSCAENGTVTAGFIEGNLINLTYWDTDQQIETFLTGEFSYGSLSPDSGGVSSPSLFGNNFTFVDVPFPSTNQHTVNLQYEDGWNLVGLPLLVEDTDYLSVFPNPITGTCYSFTSGQYLLNETVEPGIGYWLRFTDARGGGITGFLIDEVNIPISKGWNLISSITEEIAVTMIEDIDGIIVPNTSYGYSSNGYENVTSFIGGKGYWILATDYGAISINESGSGKSTEASFNIQPSNRLIVNGSPLYFGFELTEEEELSYSLPPKPPAGAFDVRFTGDTKYSESRGTIEVMNPGDALIIEYHILPNEEWKLTDGDIGEEVIISGDGIIELSGETGEIILEKVSNLPTEFVLHQNYPNPFNPTTTISFSIPNVGTAFADVSLQIYDISGRLVQTLINGSIKTGTHQVEWNGTDINGHPLASGMYFYQLNAEHYTATKKLLLIK